MDKIILYGGGGHFKVVAEAVKRSGGNLVHVFDDSLVTPVAQHTSTPYGKELYPDVNLIITIGDNAVRARLAGKVEHTFGVVIDPSAVISDTSGIGRGSMILHGTIIQAHARLGEHVIVNTGAKIDHDCTIGNFVHIGPGSVLCGNVHIGEGTFVGAGSVIIPDKKIGKWATIGAGSVVVSDIPDYAVVYGNPARIVRFNQA